MCPGMAAGHGMDGIADTDARLFQLVGHFPKGMLGLGNSHSVSWHDNHGTGILHDERGILGASRLGGLVTGCGVRSCGVASKSTEDHG